MTETRLLLQRPSNLKPPLTYHVQLCTIDSMKVYEFRKNLKAALDSALAGEVVAVERGGVTYTLTADVTKTNPKT